MIQLEGRKVLITGGSRGIGRAAALMFARCGADVAVSYASDVRSAEFVRDEIHKQGRRCLAVKADLGSRLEAVRLVEAVFAQWGEIDTLVNNAGVWTYGEIGSMDEKTWRETMSINLDGAFHVTNAVVPVLKTMKKVWIVNVASTAAVRGEALHSHYAASKGALVSWTKSLAVELAPWNILVNCVAPGWVDTDMCAGAFSDPAAKERVRRSIPLRRIPPAEDIAGPIVFLASPLARHITGEVLNVNGGSVLCGG